VGVEPTIRSAKERIAGFEGRENHRTFFAPAGEKMLRDYRLEWDTSARPDSIVFRQADDLRR
jgi:hypothetical protein